MIMIYFSKATTHNLSCQPANQPITDIPLTRVADWHENSRLQTTTTGAGGRVEFHGSGRVVVGTCSQGDRLQVTSIQH